MGNKPIPSPSLIREGNRAIRHYHASAYSSPDKGRLGGVAIYASEGLMGGYWEGLGYGE